MIGVVCRQSAHTAVRRVYAGQTASAARWRPGVATSTRQHASHGSRGAGWASINIRRSGSRANLQAGAQEARCDEPLRRRPRRHPCRRAAVGGHACVDDLKSLIQPAMDAPWSPRFALEHRYRALVRHTGPANCDAGAEGVGCAALQSPGVSVSSTHFSSSTPPTVHHLHLRRLPALSVRRSSPCSFALWCWIASDFPVRWCP